MRSRTIPQKDTAAMMWVDVGLHVGVVAFSFVYGIYNLFFVGVCK